MTKPKAKPKRPEPSADNQIVRYFHCRQCLEEMPFGTSPRDWAQIEAGSTPIGFQIWCKRHDINICHIDFEGQTHPANLNRKKVLQ